MKKCNKCGKLKFSNQFYSDASKSDGLATVCKGCRKEYDKSPQGIARTEKYSRTEKSKERYKKYEETEKARERSTRYWSSDKAHGVAERRREKYPDKLKARDAVNNAVKSGKLPHVTTLKCAGCGGDAESYHHPSYNKKDWLKVIPYCWNCHSRVN